jgi:hypothetical protein
MKNNFIILRNYFVIFIIIGFMTPIISCGNKQENKKAKQSIEKGLKGEMKMPVNFFKVIKAKNPKMIINQFKASLVKDVVFGDQYRLVGANPKKVDNGKTFVEFLFISLKDQTAIHSVILTLFDKDNKKIGKLLADIGKENESVKKGDYIMGSIIIPEKKVPEVKSYTVSIIPTETTGLKIQGGKTDQSGEKLIIGF